MIFVSGWAVFCIGVGSISYRGGQYFVLPVSAEASNISSGFGFNGYDKSGRALWDKLDNARVINVEVSGASWRRNAATGVLLVYLSGTFFGN